MPVRQIGPVHLAFDTWEELNAWLDERAKNPNVWWRGLQRWSYDLHSTLHRELVKSRVPLEQWRNRERAALTMFQRLTRERLPGWQPPRMTY
jgi:hypothetical protein